ncbi:MAG TPA: protein phosphatase 2C domain-containing protein [Pyrinomonadaceae bacterium]|nr:protein phosphatase 2C domain-containing protein [Pyrinomonadaceae bacterium]
MTEDTRHTDEFPIDTLEDSFLSEPGASMALDLAAATHTGRVRPRNEDHYVVMTFRRSLEKICTNMVRDVIRDNYELKGYGLLVADGLGGIAGGEFASRTALTKLIEMIIETPDWIMGLEDAPKAEAVLDRMTERFYRVDQTLKHHAGRDPSLSGMGTTLTAAAILKDDLIIGHIGDSRAYLFRRGLLKQVTRDHTVAQELIDAGIGVADAVTRSMRHVLTAALGSLGTRITPEVQRLQLRPYDEILLCTDGLTKMVDDKTIAATLQRANSAAKACKDLTSLALAAGGDDNITMIVARVGGSV